MRNALWNQQGRRCANPYSDPENPALLTCTLTTGYRVSKAARTNNPIGLGCAETATRAKAQRLGVIFSIRNSPSNRTLQWENCVTAKTSSKRQELSEPMTFTLPHKDFRPSNADMEREYNIPGMSLDDIRRTFFRPSDFCAGIPSDREYGSST